MFLLLLCGAICHAHGPARQPGIRQLKYGKETSTAGRATGREGSWDNAKMMEQTKDVLDLLSWHPEYKVHTADSQFSHCATQRADDARRRQAGLGIPNK